MMLIQNRFTPAFAIMLLVSAAVACAFLKPKRSPAWHITLEVDRATSDVASVRGQILKRIDTRLNMFAPGSWAEADPNSDTRLTVNLVNASQKDRVKQIVTAQGLFELVHVVSPPSPAP